MEWVIIILGAVGLSGWLMASYQQAKAEIYKRKCWELVGTMKAMSNKVKDPKCK